MLHTMIETSFHPFIFLLQAVEDHICLYTYCDAMFTVCFYSIKFNHTLPITV